jgi:hypothetical protein
MSNWINVEDRLPINSGRVLGMTNNGKEVVVCWSEGQWLDEYMLVRDIRYWMALPEPPTGIERPTWSLPQCARAVGLCCTPPFHSLNR